MDIKQWDIILINKGEYSDFINVGLFKATKAFNRNEVIELWLKDTGGTLEIQKSFFTGKHGYEIVVKEKEDQIGFVPWLIREYYIKDLSHKEMFLGSYGVELD